MKSVPFYIVKQVFLLNLFCWFIKMRLNEPDGKLQTAMVNLKSTLALLYNKGSQGLVQLGLLVKGFHQVGPTKV